MRDLDYVKEQLSFFYECQSLINDADASLDLFAFEPDEEIIRESQIGLIKLKQNLDKWELQRLLSGEYDQENAVVSINAGAGGTDAQDWVEILLRMYTRWADNHGMKITINEISEGEEAGIKSVTFEIEGTYAYGYL